MKKDTYLSDWLDGKLTDEELAQIESNEDIVLLKNIKNMTSQAVAPTVNSEEMLQKIMQTPKPKLIQTNFRYKIAVAASISVLLLSVFVLYFLNFKNISNTSPNALAFSLPDASRVILSKNAHASFQQLLWNSNREIQLTGDAYFEVQKGEKFTVQTKQGQVTVLGTKFFIQTNANQFKVTCLEGKVQVKQREKRVILTEGTQVSFVDNQMQYKENSLKNLDFEKQQLVYDNTKLSEVINQLNFHYGVQISVLQKKDFLFNGNLPMNDFSQAINILELTTELQFIKISANQYELK